MPRVSKGERETGVPDSVLIAGWNQYLKHSRKPLSPDKIKGSLEELEVLRLILARIDSMYAAAPLKELGDQLLNLRKQKRIKFSNKQGNRTAEAVREEYTEYGVLPILLRFEGMTEEEARELLGQMLEEFAGWQREAKAK